MGLEFLARVRTSSLWAGLVASLMVARYGTPADGLALALGTLWSLVNLALLQRLIVAVTGPGRGGPAALRSSGITLGGLLLLFGAGAVLLAQLPPATLLWGFLVPFAVMVLKAASLLLIESTIWRRLTRDPRRSAGILVALLLACWVAAPLLVDAAGSAPAGHAASDTAGHGAAAGDPNAEAGAGGHGDAHAAPAGPQKFANFITVISRAFPDAGWAHFLHQYEVVIFALLVALVLSLIAWAATRKAAMIPGPLQNAVEALVEALHDFIVGILGEKHGPRYVPFLGTLFIYILFMNVFGLVPFLESPTSSLNITVALALTVFFYAQYIGLRNLGLVGFLDHLCGNPRTPIQWGLVPLMLPIHVLGEFAKPISLSCRLFGNVFGEDMLLVAFVSLGVTTLAFTGLPFGLPLQLPFLLLALLTSTLQALVFTVLSTIYFLLMLPHEHGDEHAHEPHATTQAVH